MNKRSVPSIRLVAERAGVSVATVSNVINNKPNVSPDFASRVHLAVRELGYVVNRAASQMRSERHRLAGVVVPDLTNPMFASFVSTLEHVARLDGFDLIVVSARNNAEEERARLDDLRAWRPAGLIVIPCDGALTDRLPQGMGGPVVVADRIPDDHAFDLIAVNNGSAAASIAAHLSEQGFADCLVLGTSLAITNVRERWDGFRAAAGPMRAELLEVGIDDDARFQLLEERLRGPNPPRALFALDHQTSIAAYRLLGEVGLSIPHDIAFASFDEMEWMRLVSPPITAVRQPVEEMAQAAWRHLVRRLEEDRAEGQKRDRKQIRRLRCAIEIRGSTLPRCRTSRRSETA